MSELSNDVRAKVLIVEDDVIVALDLQGMVMRLGYDVVGIVDSGQAAIASAQRFRPDIILLDLILIGPLDGIDVAREIHKFLDVPVIFCTSSTDLSMLVRAKEITYAGYLLKPINPDSLSTTLDTALYEYKLEKRVEEAETRFRGLVEKCEVLQYFFDHRASFEWSWNAETLASLSGYIGTENIPALHLEEKINAFITTRLQGGQIPERLSASIEMTNESGKRLFFALIGICNTEHTIIHGLLIPLAGDIA
jgi:CheY-like chemotaxis protein